VFVEEWREIHRLRELNGEIL